MHCTRTMRCRCNMLLYYFINAFRFAFVNVDILDCAHSRPTKNSENAFFFSALRLFFLFGSDTEMAFSQWPTFDLGIADFVSSVPISFTQSLQSAQQQRFNACPVSNIRERSPAIVNELMEHCHKMGAPTIHNLLLLWHQFDFFSEFIYRQTIKRMQTNYERV